MSIRSRDALSADRFIREILNRLRNAAVELEEAIDGGRYPEAVVVLALADGFLNQTISTLSRFVTAKGA
jgi:hypothetical protein